MTVAPTAVDTKARAATQKAIAKYGRTLVLRIPTRVEVTTGSTAGSVEKSPLSTSAVAARGNHALGAALVSIDAVTLTGLLVAGDTIVFASHATVYTVTGGPYTAAANAVLNAAITPALTEAVPNDTAATVTFSGTDHTIKGFPTAIEQKFVDGQTTRAGDLQILVSTKALSDAGISIAVEHDLFLGDTTSAARAEILKLVPIASGEQDAAVYVLARER